MKKLSFKKLLAIIPAIFALISGVFVFTANNNVFAEDTNSLPSYFSIYTANGEVSGIDAVTGKDIYTYTKNSTDTFANGDSIFLKDGEAVVLEFVKNDLYIPNTNTLRINQEITYTLTLNGNVVSTTLNDENGFEWIDRDSEIFKLAINPTIASSDSFTYGNYSLTFSYWYLNDTYDSTSVSFTCNFNLLSYSNYYSSRSFSKTIKENKGEGKVEIYFTQITDILLQNVKKIIDEDVKYARITRSWNS